VVSSDQTIIEYLAGLPNGIQNLLDMGEEPMNIWSAGISYDSIIGKNYQGGILFFIDTLQIHPFQGLVCAELDLDDHSPWGCIDLFLGGTSQLLGDGQANTDIIVNFNCPESYINPAEQCNDAIINNYDDWYLPSIDELKELDVSIGFAATGSNYNKANFVSGAYHWSSTEQSTASSWAAYWEQFGPGDSFFTFNGKEWMDPAVRAIRSFQ